MCAGGAKLLWRRRKGKGAAALGVCGPGICPPVRFSPLLLLFLRRRGSAAAAAAAIGSLFTCSGIKSVIKTGKVSVSWARC